MLSKFKISVIWLATFVKSTFLKLIFATLCFNSRYCYECFKGCDQTKCKRMVLKTLPCKHLKEMCCGEDPNCVECQERCEKLLECGHPCPGICYQDCVTLKCKKPCKKTSPCGHECSGKCYEDCSQVLCKVPVDVQLQCGHMQQQLCHELDPSHRCHVLVQVTLPGCNHNIEIECWKNGAHLTCPNPCSNIRTCNHPCRAICGVPCELTPCKETIEKRLPCGHYKVCKLYFNHSPNIPGEVVYYVCYSSL